MIIKLHKNEIAELLEKFRAQVIAELEEEELADELAVKIIEENVDELYANFLWKHDERKKIYDVVEDEKTTTS